MIFNLFGKTIIFKMDKPITDIKKQKRFIKGFLKGHHEWSYKIAVIRALIEYCGKDKDKNIMTVPAAKELMEEVVNEIDYENNRKIKPPSKKTLISQINHLLYVYKNEEALLITYIENIRSAFDISLYKKYGLKIPKKLDRYYLAKLILRYMSKDDYDKIKTLHKKYINKFKCIKTKKYWDNLVSELNKIHKELQKKPDEYKLEFSYNYGSILNAYREGDVSFNTAIDILGVLGKMKNEKNK